MFVSLQPRATFARRWANTSPPIKRSSTREGRSLIALTTPVRRVKASATSARQRLGTPGGVDAAVFGGGPAGCAAALHLTQQGCSVTILERAGVAPAHVGETLPGSIRAPLTELGLWARALRFNHIPSYETRSAWGRPDLEARSFLFDPYGPSWHVDFRQFRGELLGAAQECGVDVQYYEQLGPLEWTGRAWDVRLAGAARRYRAHFLVDATGRACTVARRLGGERIHEDRLVALVGFVEPRDCSRSDNATLVEAAPDGWWYSAHLPDGRLALAYMTDADLLPLGAASRYGSFWAHLGLTGATQDRVSPDTSPTQIHVLSANSSRLARGTGDGWLAVGDAFAAFDPLCGCGVLRALQNGLRAASAVTQLLAGNKRAAVDYRASCVAEFDRYLDFRDAYYSIEPRWPRSRFWERRRRRTAIAV